MSYALGSIIGSLVGDAAGVTLEFYKGGAIDEAIAEKAMRMPGGGTLNVAPGQISDDGELTMALYNALKKSMSGGVDLVEYPIEAVATAYSEWHSSLPFDCGMTCGRAFGFFKCAESMQHNAAKYSILSEANGALMRCTPIPALFYKLSYAKIAEYAVLDASLSHPSEICKNCNALYCVAIAYLIKNYSMGRAERARGAIDLIDSWNTWSPYTIHPKVQSWLEDSKKDKYDGDCRVNIGHVKHAFILAMHFLRKCASYEDAIKQTLMMGGDTDTNACIVGGMMGALHGYGFIPDYMKGPVLKFDPVTWNVKESLLGYNRPGIYRPFNVVRDRLNDLL
jgi:ADP-ribosyl-[dinitrogen reductase] hydrolase